jgi:hypothetical protein
VWLTRVLIGALALVVAGEIAVIAPRLDILVVPLVACWMVLPGIVLARRAFGVREPSSIAAWLVGPALGLGFGGFGLLVLWAAGLQNWLAIIGGPGFTWAIVVLAGRFGGPSVRLPRFDRRDVPAVAIALLVVPLVTWAPYDHVREPVADGEAYRAYFTADFVWGMTVTAELAKGAVPPANPFLRGSELHYYWASHLLSGAIYRNVRAWGITAEQVLLIHGLVFGLVAVPFLYALARFAGGTPVFASLAVLVAFLANSYEGVNRLWILYQQQAPLSLVTTLNIDAVTRWFYQGMPVDGLQRMLLYQPHHLTGYLLALAALWLVAFAEDVTETSVALWAGILLGLAFLFSTFTAIIVGVALGALYAARLVAQRAYGSIWQCAVLGGGPVVVAVAISVALRYTDPGAGFLIRFGLNPVALRHWPFALLLSFGPLLLAGIVGVLRVKWIKRDGAAAVALVLSALAFYFLADVPDQQGVWVGWRSGHLLLIGFMVMGAAALTTAWRHTRWRVPIVVLLVVATVPAVPTVAIDVYNAQDITNRTEGPGFPWTTIISPSEREALDWIRRATPDTAIVQYEPLARGASGWCYITAFAERRMAAGLPGAMIPFRPFQLATDDVRMGIFRASSASEAHHMATFLEIDYILIGAVERRMYNDTLVEIARHPDLFLQVFDNHAVTIYAVQR